MTAMIIYCCECGSDKAARLTDGKEIYPHRPDLFSFPFWKCNACGNYVGCHHKTKNRTRPLGVIPNAPIKAARKKIHAMIDPVWKSGKLSRGRLYGRISRRLGYEYHTANIRSVAEADTVIAIAADIIQQLASNQREAG